jgi:hypothetical protein
MGEKIEQKNCDDPAVGDQILSYLNGHTSSECQLRIETHLKRCKDCREELKFIKAAKRVQQEDFTAAAFAFLKQRV